MDGDREGSLPGLPLGLGVLMKLKRSGENQELSWE